MPPLTNSLDVRCTRSCLADVCLVSNCGVLVCCVQFLAVAFAFLCSAYLVAFTGVPIVMSLASPSRGKAALASAFHDVGVHDEAELRRSEKYIPWPVMEAAVVGVATPTSTRSSTSPSPRRR
jgi:hypothetical protein